MRQTSIILTVSEPQGDIHEFVYTGASRVVVGRAGDCDLHVHADFEHRNVLDHHCVLEVDPPRIRVRDLGSLYGTFVNGDPVGGGWYDPLDPEPVVAPEPEEKELKDGDELIVGPMLIHVHVEEPDNPAPLGLSVLD